MTLRKSSDLFIIGLLTVVAVVLISTGIQNIVRVLFVLPLALLFPGYTLIVAMFPDRTFAIESHIGLAVALSIACIVLGGLLLNFLPWGLTTQSWTILLTGVIFVSIVLGLVRRSWRSSRTDITLPLSVNWQQIALFALAVVLTFAAVRLARIGITTQPQPGFTQLWMLPASADVPDSVQLGIRNEENSAHTYRLVVVDANQNPIGQWDAINLEPGEQWEGTFHLNTNEQVLNNRIVAQLYRDDTPDTIYRNVSLILNSETSSP